jgi:hypothetical protein
MALRNLWSGAAAINFSHFPQPWYFLLLFCAGKKVGPRGSVLVNAKHKEKKRYNPKSKNSR